MKKYIILFILTSLVLTSCGKEEIKTVQKYYSTEVVKTGSIDLNTSFVWYIESENTVSLSAKMWWKITNIYKSEWDKVQVWEVLAKLDWSEAKVWYSTASNIVSTLEVMRSQTELMFDSQIEAMEARVEQVEVWNLGMQLWLKDTKNINESQLKTAESWVNQAEVWLETTKTNLEQTKLVLNTKEKHIYKNTISAITNSIILDTNIINFIDILLWITEQNKDKNDSFQDYLSARDTIHLRDSKKEFLEVNELFTEYKKVYEEKIENKNPDNETIKEITEQWIILAEKIKVLLSSTYDVLDNSIDNVQLTLNTINTYKFQISEMWQNIESSLLSISWDYILWLKGSIENTQSFKSESKMQISLLEKQIELAEKRLETAKNTYDQYKAISEWQINEVTTKKNITEISLKEVLAWLEALKNQKQSSLTEIQAKIDESKWQINSAWVMILNSEVISPISWIVIKKISEVWQVIWWGMPLLIVADETKLQIKIWVDDTNIKGLKTWDIVKIEVESIEKHIIWTVINIYPSKDNITKTNIVEISINDIQVKIWTMVKVYFENQKSNQENSIIITNKAIVQRFMIPWVYVLKNWKAIFKNIEILEQDNNFSKISWLELWEIIITDGKENIHDGEQLIINN